MAKISALIKAFIEIAKKNADKNIIYTNKKAYSYGMLLAQFQQLSHMLPINDDRKVIAVTSPDPIERIMLYFTAVEKKYGYLSFPPDIDSETRKEIQTILRMQGNIPIHSFSIVTLENSINRAAEGEIIFPVKGISEKRNYIRIAHHDFCDRLFASYDFDYVEEKSQTLLVVPPWKLMGLKEILRSVLNNQVIFLPKDTGLQSIFEILKTHMITNLIIGPSTLSGIIYDHEFKTDYFRGVKYLRYYREPIQMETLIQIQSLFPEIQFYADYGLSETIGTIAIMGPDIHKNAGTDHYLPTLEKFISGVEVRLIDQFGNDVPEGEVGELIVHTPWQYRGVIGGSSSEYWISTEDIGWFDKNGYFNLSGFRQNSRTEEQKIYILPAVARKQYVSIPIFESVAFKNTRAEFNVQNMLMLIHASLNIDEIKHYYMELIPGIVDAQAYGFDLFPIKMREPKGMIYVDQPWYQDVLSISASQKLFLIDKNRKVKQSINELELFYEEKMDIIYIPLCANNTDIHGMISFARSVQKGHFAPWEITILKRVSHHLNLAILNARNFQEIQTRQIMLKKTIDFSDIATVLSDMDDSIYFMNSAMKELLDSEEQSPLHNSIVLERLKDNLHHMKDNREQEYVSKFAFYSCDTSTPVMLYMRSVRILEKTDYVSTFISPDLNQDKMHFGDLAQVLSEKEQGVLSGLCKGFSYKEIAKEMCISVNTVNFHIKNIYRKMNVNSRNELLNSILYLGKNGLRYSEKR